MSILKVLVPGALLLGLAVGLAFVRADEAPKLSIKKVMDEAHKPPKGMDDAPSLYNKVKSGDATDAEKKKLVELYTALAADHPKLNDDDDWKTRTEAMVAAAKEVEAGKEGGVNALKKAADCKECHKLHKPPRK